MGENFDQVRKTINVDGKDLSYYSLPDLADPRFAALPYSVRILLESAVRNCDGLAVKKADVEKILDWKNTSTRSIEIPFKPARVLMQDFTGVPAVVDLAAMRDAMARLGGDPKKINPMVPVDLVIDHSVQVDVAREANSLSINQAKEFERNKERFQFLKWGSQSFNNMLVVPPGSGIVHQVNLEYLARVVFNNNGVLYPDSLVGTDSHTTMINGLGVCGWGVGGIEAEATMLGQHISMVLPEVIGYHLTGTLPQGATATDLVLTVVQNLRERGVVGKFVEFFGSGVAHLTIADRATLANMAPEYGATVGFFPVDAQTIKYLKDTNRSDEQVKYTEAYLRAQGLFCDHEADEAAGKAAGAHPISYTDVLELDLSTVVSCVAGPKRPQDRVALSDLAADFKAGLTAARSFKGFGLQESELANSGAFEFKGEKYTLNHGDIVIAAITSCTNTSNPSVMLGAGLLAQKAVEHGLSVAPYIKTSLAPGSGVVSAYLEKSGLQDALDKIGFNIVAFGCTTCIGNSGDIPEGVSKAISDNNLMVTSVLSGNRNFEARVHPQTAGNYLASPPLVVAYALAGNVTVDFETTPLGVSSKTGKEVFLRDLWPTRAEIDDVIGKSVVSSMFKDVYEKITAGNEEWNSLAVEKSELYGWEDSSTYIHSPPFFATMGKEVPPVPVVKDARVLLLLGDSVTTDHISPAGRIARSCPAQRYLAGRGVEPKDFNTYGSRRGNDEVMVRGTFANVRIFNKMAGESGPRALHVPTDKVMDIFDVSALYKEEGRDMVVVAGGEYGTGSSRDWAAKGPFLLGIKAVIAKSYERIHRSNLVGMGIIPLQFKAGENSDTYAIDGKELFTIDVPEQMKPSMPITVHAGDKTFETVLRLDTEVEIEYVRHGGILNYVLRRMANED